jgi:hypothetical protein
MDRERPEQEEKEPLFLDEKEELFSSMQKKQNVTVRDDHFDFNTLLDAARLFKDRSFRFRLIDTGVYDSFELEWITAQGADLYTSDKVRPDVRELELINASSKRGNAIVAYLVDSRSEADGEEAEVSFIDLVNAGRSGVYIHLTGRERTQGTAQIALLAHNCRRGGSWLIYYHHGSLEESLVEVGGSGAWIHISDRSLADEQSRSWVRDIVRSTQSSGANLVLHWEKGVQFSVLEDVVKAGAVVLLKSALFDSKSPIKALEKGIRRKRLDYRSYYLYPTVLP